MNNIDNMKRAHIIILLLYFIFPLIKSEETKWECMKAYYDEVAFPYIINKYEEIFKAGYSGTLLVLSRGNDLAYAEKFSVYASEREDIMPLIRNYNKAWHEKMSHRYEKSADILRELLGSEYFKIHKNNILKYISSCELTCLESYNGRENSELSHVQYFSGIKSEKHADAILDKQNFNIYLNSKPKQDFIDKYVNDDRVYPIKIKGDIVCWAKLKGNVNNFDLKSNLNLSKRAPHSFPAL